MPGATGIGTAQPQLQSPHWLFGRQTTSPCVEQEAAPLVQELLLLLVLGAEATGAADDAGAEAAGAEDAGAEAAGADAAGAEEARADGLRLRELEPVAELARAVVVWMTVIIEVAVTGEPAAPDPAALDGAWLGAEALDEAAPGARTPPSLEGWP